MAIAIERLERTLGVEKMDAEESLLQIATDLKRMNEIVKIRTDQEVWQLFQHQQQLVQKVEEEMKGMLSDK